MPRVVLEYKEKARDRIAKAAHEVFSKKGYHETTMDDIAAQLGVSKGALYQYFKSKEELYKAILTAGFRNFTDMVQSTPPSGGDLAETCEALFDNLTQNPSGLGLSFEVVSEASRNPALAKVVRENFKRIVDAIEQCLGGAKKNAAARDTDLRLLTQGLVALYEGLMVYLAIGVERSEVRRIFVQFMKTLQEGIP